MYPIINSCNYIKFQIKMNMHPSTDFLSHGFYDSVSRVKQKLSLPLPDVAFSIHPSSEELLYRS